VTAFILIGSFGLALLLIGLLLGDHLDGVFDALHLDAAAGILSTPVIGAFFAAFGFGGAMALSGLEFNTGPASAVGLGAGLALGSLTAVFMRSVMRMSTDVTPRTADLVGKTGVVLTRVPAGGLGEVRVAHLGQQLKLAARCDEPVPAGTTVVVVAVASATAVVVTPAGF